MAGKRSKAAYWNPIVDNDKIRNVVKYKMEVKGWSMYELSKLSGITYSRLSRWFNNNAGGITAIQVYQILDLFGLDLEITVKNKDEV